jgi:hypothetical protein
VSSNVYGGADGIPGNEDDDVYVVPDYPIEKQEILFFSTQMTWIIRIFADFYSLSFV